MNERIRILAGDEMIYVDDFLTPGTLADIQGKRYDVLDEQDHDNEYVRRKRFEIFHTQLEAELATFMQDETTQKLVARWRDHAWRCVASHCLKGCETYLSVYQPGDSMFWHCDHLHDHRVLAWFLPLNEPQGGDLRYTRSAWDVHSRHKRPPCQHGVDGYKRFPPKVNRLLVMPAWVPHKVDKARRERRILHGHFIA